MATKKNLPPQPRPTIAEIMQDAVQIGVLLAGIKQGILASGESEETAEKVIQIYIHEMTHQNDEPKNVANIVWFGRGEDEGDKK